MAMTEKIKILLVKKEMSAAKLAAQLETSPQNLYNKLKRDNFSERADGNCGSLGLLL